ncbi:hypothetical protein TDB9533_00133 [Thalassocella blandensis]|nr:hypothetical protein TDB9533_00133 [Thalassocella blandensis]
MKIKSYAQFNILLAFALSLLVGCSPKGDVEGANSADNAQSIPAASKAKDSQQATTMSQSKHVVISGAFIKQLPPGKTMAAVYLSMKNNSDKTQTLNYVHSPIAENIEVHRVIYNQGMMKMRHVKHFHINPGQNLVFEPGGYHLMIFGISESLEVGSTFPLTLEFEGNETHTIDVLVKPHG